MKRKRYFRTKDYFVAPSNFAAQVEAGYALPQSVEIHDVTLRDGEQQAGVTFTPEDKIQIARALSEAGVHRIEAGMPAVSKADARAIGEIVKLGLSSKIFVFSRATGQDVRLAADLGVDGVVLEIPTNEELIRFGYRWPEEKALQAAVEASSLAHELGLYVNLFLMDSSRLTPEAFVQLVQAVQRDGHVDSATLVDTQGVLSTPAAKWMVSQALQALDIPLELHFHNDLGLGVSNTLGGFEQGGSVLHTTVLGLGPRAGQAATEQVALALGLLYGVDCGLRLDKLYGLGQLVADLAQFRTAVNQPVVGEVLYTIESGLPAGWWQRIRQRHPLALYGILPSVMGRPEIAVALGKMSGIASVQIWLEKLGLPLPEAAVQEAILAQVKDKSIQLKRTLTEEEFRAIVQAHL